MFRVLGLSPGCLCSERLALLRQSELRDCCKRRRTWIFGGHACKGDGAVGTLPPSREAPGPLNLFPSSAGSAQGRYHDTGLVRTSKHFSLAKGALSEIACHTQWGSLPHRLRRLGSQVNRNHRPGNADPKPAMLRRAPC